MSPRSPLLSCLPLGLLLLLVLAGCGTGAASGTHPCPSSSARSGGPPTHSTGPVTNDTDHSVYAPDAPMQLTFTDNLSTDVQLDTTEYESACLFFKAQPQVNGSWSSNLSPFCTVLSPHADMPAPPFAPILASHQAWTYTLDANAITTYRMHLVPGTYRWFMTYTSLPDYKLHRVVVTSQPFRICTCATCS
jgi:hypothetical protein